MTRFGRDFSKITRAKGFRKPLSWKKPRSILVSSWTDFFHEDVPTEWRQEAWEIMFFSPQHTFLILTKRPENMKGMLPVGWIEGMWKRSRHIWLGVSAENQAMANLRIPKLLEIPAQVHFVSAEPLLAPIDFSRWLRFQRPEYRSAIGIPTDAPAVPPIDWIITGGESDLRNPRAMDLDWVADIRDQCQEAGVAFFHKQMGGSSKCKCHGAWGCRLLGGRTWGEFPDGR
jgi:protein gp37